MSFYLAVTMPVFNEEPGITDFLIEISENLAEYRHTLIVVDDDSSDKTVSELLEFQGQFRNVDLILIQNEKNIGHGPSTIKGMMRALEINPDAIITVDGDGQFLGSDFAKAIKIFTKDQVDVLEGVRTGRADPFFRTISTQAVRFLVWLRCHKLPSDGNTPFRIYRTSKLRELLVELPSNFLIPNVYSSTYVRKQNWNLVELEVASIPPRGKDPLGSTWGQKFKRLPSKRFIKFCARAFWQWVASRFIP